MLALRQIPNYITVARMLCVVPLVWVLMVESYGWALVIALTAGITDAVDGFLARHFGWRSELGGILDPLADKTLLAAAFVVLTTQGHLPVWLLALVLGRDLLIVIGGVSYHYAVAPVKADPTLVSKLNTCLQIALVLLVLVALSVWPAAADWQNWLVAATAASSLYSGAEYVIVWGYRAWRHNQEGPVA